ncbi:alternative oxidase [Novymonas esmeraldas]|uniref:Alternative oxidase n=1 Tax=Novymonas esmeraldas TaxID=1808958 RepID=A0AAW0F327_9TRYP
MLAGSRAYSALGVTAALLCARRHVADGGRSASSRLRMRHSLPRRTAASVGSWSAGRAAAPSTTPSASPPTRHEPPTYLYRPFMGHSTRFAAMTPPLTRDDITQLEREPLSHSTPGRVNDHICIAMVKTLRWLADRAFRERYIHRATMLVTVAAAAPAAASVAAYLRMFFKRRSNSGTRHGEAKTSAVAEASSPFLSFDSGASPPAPASGHSSHRSCSTNAAVSGAALEHCYVDELRGLFAQSESHAVHYQVLGSMAEITPVERGLVLLLQGLHFAICLTLFLFYPRMGFRLMAYTAEESSVVWTQMVNDIDLGKIAVLRVPQLALHYWGVKGLFTAQAPPPPAVVASPPDQGLVLYSAIDADAAAVRPADAAVDARSADTTTPTTTATPDPAPLAGEAEAAAVREAQQHDGAAGDELGGEESGVPPADSAADPAASVLTLRDVVLLIRSDEMVFRDLNHEMANELDTQRSWLQRLVDTSGRRG